MKFTIETGSGQHTTSYARLTATFANGEFAGQHLYQQKQYQVSAEWDKSARNELWATTIYNLPEGTQIRVTGKGQDGPRGINKYKFDSIFEVKQADLEISIDMGIHECILSGNLVLVKDL